MKTVLTIAGSDCSGGAGIQADLKTFTVHRVYGMSVITALTAQNTTGVYGVMEVEPEFVGHQLDCIFTDIPPDAVKIGMVANREIIRVIGEKLREYGAKNVVVDPVMVATSGGKLLDDLAIATLVKELIQLATVITPNIPEAESLTGITIRNREDMVRAARELAPYTRGAVLVKGGHLSDVADDLLYMKSEIHWLRAPKIDNENTHGTGCTLSSAIACNLALGYDLLESVQRAKEYITGAIAARLNLGQGRGPLNHSYAIR
ncbi:MAG TPA: bifunctional hydroxymethylpyrimidine kinase/phosphomethylpyrimidine kinase [Firmicutes bacterium]|nr:bifunctional hydroxymethylpyrimidine kinase/phosphomethylpyrimidine kinase [Bacillota bacterium]